MIRRSRLLLLLVAVTLAFAFAGIPDVSGSSGLICGPHEPPIPCSNFNQGTCVYSYDKASNCCKSSGCLSICC